MDVSTKFGSAQGCAVRTGALKTDGQCKIKKWLGRLFFCLLYFGRSKKSKVAVKGERPTMKVTPEANKRRLIPKKINYDLNGISIIPIPLIKLSI
jgi:hypothetical protein